MYTFWSNKNPYNQFYHWSHFEQYNKKQDQISDKLLARLYRLICTELDEKEGQFLSKKRVRWEHTFRPHPFSIHNW